MNRVALFGAAALLAVAGLAAACFWLGREPRVVPALAVLALDPRTLILAPHRGAEPIDRQIVELQQRLAGDDDPRLHEKLGWLFVSKARLSHDPGYYRLAEQCALAAGPEKPESLLLRGHALQSLHGFREAEAIARQLVGQRDFFLDHALLGDALMEQGRLDAAAEAYQTMADLRPCLQVFTRIAHLRWLKGDLEGALEMAEEAAGTGTARDPEPLAWALVQLASYRRENGEDTAAATALERALQLVPNYAPALLQRGRLLLAQDQATSALTPLRAAAQRNPLPEYQWTLADALRAAGEVEEAVRVEADLEFTGAARDPRSFALYLATRGRRLDEARALAQQELAGRQDVFTYDALAWTSFAAGRLAEARAYAAQACAEGTGDARLRAHAAIIAGTSLPEDALRLLLPSERAALPRPAQLSKK